MNPSVQSTAPPDGKKHPLGSDLDKHPSAMAPKSSQDEVQRVEVMDGAFLATDRSLVCKLDSILMPTVFILYLFNYLDRNNIAQARLDSLEEDLGLTGNDYSLAVSILVVGFLYVFL